MSRPLPFGDPVRLGPFRLTARLSETPAGITYLGTDAAGRQVCVAVMTRGAAGDAAARDRFRAAIVAADRRDPVPVLAAEPDGPTPWVATAYDPHRQGAERFLDSVLLKGVFGRRGAKGRRGPQFQPYWIGSRDPAVGSAEPAPSNGGPGTEARSAERGLIGAIITLAALLGLLLLVFALLYACQPVRPPDPLPTDVPSQPFEEFTPTPTPTTPTPSPSPSRTRTGTPTGAPGSGAAA